jgi:hypothetical protein
MAQKMIASVRSWRGVGDTFPILTDSATPALYQDLKLSRISNENLPCVGFQRRTNNQVCVSLQVRSIARQFRLVGTACPPAARIDTWMMY